MRKAFTLIELLIVVSIISILSVIIVIAIGNAQAKSRDTKRKADLMTISSALEAYKSLKGAYPNSVGSGCNLSPGTWYIRLDKNPQDCTTVNELVVSGYLSAFPFDPFDPDPANSLIQGYFYTTRGGTANYKIIKKNPELLNKVTTVADCQKIAGEFYDPQRNCTANKAYQVTSNLVATTDW